MPAYYVGLMSGTSVDGIDAVVVDLAGERPVLVAAQGSSWDSQLREQIFHTLEHPEHLSLQAFGSLDAALGDAFADAALAIIDKAGLKPSDIAAIGSHGQTLFHAPSAQPAFSLQVGDGSRIAARTGITTVADFRRRDIAEGGQGAPLVPAFHQAVFSARDLSRAILNIGGIANLTLLPAGGGTVTGFDTGPGNVLMDAWTGRHRTRPFDLDGEWARSGTFSEALLAHLMDQPYLQLPPPKSTGRELFSLAWLDRQLKDGFSALAPDTVQATLAEFTVASIADALKRFSEAVQELYVCGGGAGNSFLMERLQAHLPACRTASTEALGLHPDWVEATAFAWLASRTLAGHPGNLPGVTGARRAAVLGAVYPA
jgi:anhydro-N-acetylmuramic acid kinase